MQTIAFLGLGTMGRPMAANLATAGFAVRGWNRTPGRADDLLRVGGHESPTLADAVEDADVVITMLPDSPQVEEVAGEVLAHAAPGTLLIDMSTIAPATTVRLAGIADARGIRTLDAPVAGGEAGAVAGTLSIMVGGEEADFHRAHNVFAALGSRVVHCGPHGRGQLVKASNQLMLAVITQACAEAVVFLERAGVDLDTAFDVLEGGLAASAVLSRKRANFRDRDFTPSFTLALHHKDLGIGIAAAHELGAAVPLGAAAAELLAAAVRRGDAELDHSALLRGVELLSEPGHLTKS